MRFSFSGPQLAVSPGNWPLSEKRNTCNASASIAFFLYCPVVSGMEDSGGFGAGIP